MQCIYTYIHIYTLKNYSTDFEENVCLCSWKYQESLESTYLVWTMFENIPIAVYNPLDRRLTVSVEMVHKTKHSDADLSSNC